MKDRYTFDGTSINGYYAIYDSKNEDNTIWVDCNIAQLNTILMALNEEDRCGTFTTV